MAKFECKKSFIKKREKWILSFKRLSCVLSDEKHFIKCSLALKIQQIIKFYTFASLNYNRVRHPHKSKILHDFVSVKRRFL